MSIATESMENAKKRLRELIFQKHLTFTPREEVLEEINKLEKEIRDDEFQDKAVGD